MMKKALFFTAFMALALSSFAVDLPNRSVFIEGTSTIPGHRLFFLQNFAMEAGALGFNVVENKADAGYIFKFDVQPYSDDYDPSINFIVLITLIMNDGNIELVNFGWPYAELDDMYEYNQFVFFRAAVLIPSISDEDLLALQQSAAPAAGTQVLSRDWQNKLLYLRLSLDYPITFYTLQPGDLYGGTSIVDDLSNINYIMPLNNIQWPAPGATIGVEFQFLKFMSLEVNFQASMGDTSTYYFYNLAAGAELKYILKLNHFMIQPYAAFSYPLNVSDVFKEFPEFAFGGGIQIAVRGSCSGAFFLNINYMMHLTDAVMYNRYTPLFPDPNEIYYKRFVIGLGIGYKHGFIDR